MNHGEPKVHKTGSNSNLNRCHVTPRKSHIKNNKNRDSVPKVRDYAYKTTLNRFKWKNKVIVHLLDYILFFPFALCLPI